jgi:hypothetical protein
LNDFGSYQVFVREMEKFTSYTGYQGVVEKLKLTPQPQGGLRKNTDLKSPLGDLGVKNKEVFFKSLLGGVMTNPGSDKIGTGCFRIAPAPS